MEWILMLVFLALVGPALFWWIDRCDRIGIAKAKLREAQERAAALRK